LSHVISDKTQVFHDKIQDKQKELQPWTAQINTKQAEIDVATSERDALAKKAEALKGQMKEAEEKFSSLQSESKTKVLSIIATIDLDLIVRQVEHQNELRTEKGQLQKRIQEADKLFKVRDYLFSSLVRFLML
jgi:structural maintenance of chromosome 4